ncbi:BRE1 E3 ubiquitin ligase-domain-containing protein [Lipomyces oligophaga]|uniref:BRE1 E3 ubiquitin ligase-domain-containing protein n=1 Tax=Lipomyces oligophaga TaxID=45792 RepID=UPI0034CEB6D3
MDERKRSLSVKAEHEDSPPLKRQATEEVPSSQDEVSLFKKEAIFRQMQVYKRERDVLQSRLAELEQQSAYHDDHVRLLELWWDQLINEISILFGKPLTSASDDCSVPRSLLESNSQEYSAHLAAKRNLIIQSLTAIFTSDNSPPEIKALQDQLRDISNQVTCLKVENEHLKDERDDLDRRLTDATLKFMTAEKKMDRLKSSTLAKIERPQMVGSSASAKKSSPEVEAKKQQAEKQDSPTNDQALSHARQEFQAVIAKQNEELDRLQKQITELQQTITTLNIKFSSLGESEVANSEPYKTLKLRYDETATRTNHLEAMNDMLKRENDKLSSERTEYKDLIAAEYQAINSETESQINRLEIDLARIRTARDDLLAEIAVLKAKDETKLSGLEELKSLAALRDSRIQSLESEVERLKTKFSVDSSSPSASASTSAVMEKLERENKYLAAELPSMEAAFNQAHRLSTKKVMDILEKDEKYLRLVAEKTKADQKYFAAMRAKEAVSLENKTLRTQSSKSGEIIQQLKEAEKSSSQKVSLLEKQVSEHVNARHVYDKQLQEAARRAVEQKSEIERYKQQIDKYGLEIKTRSDQINTEASSRRAAEQQVENLKAQLDTFKPNGAGPSNGEQTQIEALRSMTMCSVCSKNWKDTVIKVCGHCFCQSCAKDRLNARIRKCPACNKQYSFNDLMAIHL